MAAGVTVIALLIKIRAVMYPGHANSGWLFQPGIVPLGWPLVAWNIAIYCYICWLAFWFIRGMQNRERLFMAGWSIGMLLWPLRMLLPHWARATEFIGAFGQAVALLAALSLLYRPSNSADSDGVVLK